MKLSIELKDEKFEYSYDLGEEGRGTLTMPISLDELRLFVSLCDKALIERNKEYERKFKETGLKALIETDYKLVKKWLKEHKKRFQK